VLGEYDSSVLTCSPTIIAATSSVSISVDGIHLTVGMTAAPFIRNYQLIGDVYTEISMSDLPSSTLRSSYSYDGTVMGLVMTAAPFLKVYSVINHVYTNIPIPVANAIGAGNDVAFSEDGQTMVAIAATAPYACYYEYDIGTSAYVRQPNFSTNPVGVCSEVTLTRNGHYLAISHAGAPYLSVWQKVADSYISVSMTGLVPIAAGMGCSFDETGNYLVYTHAAAPFIRIFRRSGHTFGVVDNLLNPPSVAPSSVSFSHSGEFLSLTTATAASPFLISYRADLPFDKTTHFSVPMCSVPCANNVKEYIKAKNVNNNFIGDYSTNPVPYTMLRKPFSISQTLVENVMTKITWDTAILEQGGVTHDASDVTIPLTGLYTISLKYSLETIASSTGAISFQVEHNSISPINTSSDEYLLHDTNDFTGTNATSTDSNMGIAGNLSGTFPLTAGDKVWASVIHTYSDPQDVIIPRNQSVQTMYFTVCMVR
jgi:hypothetical protein